MKTVPGTLRGGGATFATTHWSVIAACTPGTEMETDKADAALAQLCLDYWPPLYSFVRRRGNNPADAQDLVQGFFAYLLQSKAYARTNRHKGKFRSFLLAAFKHYMADAWDRGRAIKRGGDHTFVPLDEEIKAVETLYATETAEPSADAEQHYERRWAAALVGRALDRVGAEFGAGPKARLFRGLKPFLSGGINLPSQDEVARQLDMPIETLRSHLSRLRARYRSLLREEVARTISKVDDVDEELRHLCSVLTASS